MERENLEEWRQVPGFEKYYVSNKGNIKSLYSHATFYKKPMHLIKPIRTPNGYFKVFLRKNKKSKHFFVHRVVALAFFGESKLHINHKDGNKINNCVENLEYVTQIENNRHSVRLGLAKKTRTGKERLTKDDILAIRFFYHRSISGILCKIYNRKYSTISEVVRGKSFRWVD